MKLFPGLLCALLCAAALVAADPTPTKNFTDVEAVFVRHCLDCHATQDPEANLILESFETLMKGGESGASIVPGKSADSLLVKMIEGTFEKDGKKKLMPPGKRKKLTPEEIATIQGWIDAGAKPPSDGKSIAKQLVVPKIAPRVAPRRPINALTHAPGPKLIAVARYGEVELRAADSRTVVRTLAGHRGNVAAVAFSTDGKHLFAAAGEAGLFGEVRQWNVADGKLLRTFEGHKDALYAVALSPDGRTMATGGYDQKIKLWKIETGEEIKSLSGHNGCVFDLAFRPDGKILASASADRTVKLWDVAGGERRDTLAQSLKELYTVAFSRDGKRLFAGGVDNRIRVWEISESAAETTNPLLDAKFAHEGAILNLVFSTDGKSLLSSADDRTVKLWDAAELKEKLALEKQPDWPPALTFASENKTLVVGRLDGSLDFYQAATGKLIPPPKPELTRVEPRGLQRGASARFKLSGTNLTALTEAKFVNPKITAVIVRDGQDRTNEALIEVTAEAGLPRGPYEFSVAHPGGESGTLKLHVDDIPQRYEGELKGEGKADARPPAAPPFGFWGAIDPRGDADRIEFDAKAGQSLVFDVAAKSLGSKAGLMITLFDDRGNLLANARGFDGGDPLMAFKTPSTGRYHVEVRDGMLGGSPEHFYRLSIGTFAEVVACYPLSVPANRESDVELIGYNLPAKTKVRLKAGPPGEMEVPVDPEQFRSRRALKVLVSDSAELIEAEPNDTPAQATPIKAPCAVAGRIGVIAPALNRPAGTRSARRGEGAARGATVGTTTPSDTDLFRFDARAGQAWIIETAAAQRGSPVDTKIEVLRTDGQPVPRLLLQAVRDSAINFRGVDSNGNGARLENWEEMDLNQYVYLRGEVARLFRMPQGPDSDLLFYTSAGKRRAYFDTSATAHALDETCYIVEPHPPGAKPAANGLPAFPLHYANDDDGERKLGSDSKLHFTAPADGSYLIRVTDARGYGGDRFVYRLVVREAKPDFKVTLTGANPVVSPGSGQSLTVNAERFDNFDGDIRIDITGLPSGFTVTSPLVLQAGHTEARGAIHAASDAPAPSATNGALTKVAARAMIGGQSVTQEVNNLGLIKLGNKPKLTVHLEPYTDDHSTNVVAVDPARPFELTLAPGQTIPAWLKIRRSGHDDLVTFTVDNLPHGVIVDNIGLNGVLIPKGDSERQIFFNCAKWVPDTDRLCFAIENQAGRQTSVPVLLRVRRPAPGATVSAK